MPTKMCILMIIFDKNSVFLSDFSLNAKYGDLTFMTPIFMLKHVSDDSSSHDIIGLSLKPL